MDVAETKRMLGDGQMDGYQMLVALESRREELRERVNNGGLSESMAGFYEDGIERCDRLLAAIASGRGLLIVEKECDVAAKYGVGQAEASK